MGATSIRNRAAATMTNGRTDCVSALTGPEFFVITTVARRASQHNPNNQRALTGLRRLNALDVCRDPQFEPASQQDRRGEQASHDQECHDSAFEGPVSPSRQQHDRSGSARTTRAANTPR